MFKQEDPYKMYEVDEELKAFKKENQYRTNTPVLSGPSKGVYRLDY